MLENWLNKINRPWIRFTIGVTQIALASLLLGLIIGFVLTWVLENIFGLKHQDPLEYARWLSTIIAVSYVGHRIILRIDEIIKLITEKGGN